MDMHESTKSHLHIIWLQGDSVARVLQHFFPTFIVIWDGTHLRDQTAGLCVMCNNSYIYTEISIYNVSINETGFIITNILVFIYDRFFFPYWYFSPMDKQVNQVCMLKIDSLISAIWFQYKHLISRCNEKIFVYIIKAPLHVSFWFTNFFQSNVVNTKLFMIKWTEISRVSCWKETGKENIYIYTETQNIETWSCVYLCRQG